MAEAARAAPRASTAATRASSAPSAATRSRTAAAWRGRPAPEWLPIAPAGPHLRFELPTARWLGRRRCPPAVALHATEFHGCRHRALPAPRGVRDGGRVVPAHRGRATEWRHPGPAPLARWPAGPVPVGRPLRSEHPARTGDRPGPRPARRSSCEQPRWPLDCPASPTDERRKARTPGSGSRNRGTRSGPNAGPCRIESASMARSRWGSGSAAACCRSMRVLPGQAKLAACPRTSPAGSPARTPSQAATSTEGGSIAVEYVLNSPHDARDHQQHPGGGGRRRKGRLVQIREEREATCFISAPADLLAVARVVRVDLKDHYLVLATAKDDHFAFAYEDVLGFKLSPRPSQGPLCRILALARSRGRGFRPSHGPTERGRGFRPSRRAHPLLAR